MAEREKIEREVAEDILSVITKVTTSSSWEQFRNDYGVFGQHQCIKNYIREKYIDHIEES